MMEKKKKKGEMGGRWGYSAEEKFDAKIFRTDL